MIKLIGCSRLQIVVIQQKVLDAEIFGSLVLTLKNVQHILHDKPLFVGILPYLLAHYRRYIGQYDGMRIDITLTEEGQNLMYGLKAKRRKTV